jgi:F0F1-type ATP synthase membrane subunit b/b'
VNAFIKYSILCSSLFSAVVALAEEEAVHHEPSIFDLKYSTLNFIVLFGFLGWKLKKPMSSMFDKKSDDIKTLMSSAEKQNKDAEERLNQFHSKIKNIESEVIKINSEYETDAISFAKMHQDETQTSIARMQRDVQNKLESEKKEMLDVLNHEMVSQVVASAKMNIEKNSELKKNATLKIMTELK